MTDGRTAPHASTGRLRGQHPGPRRPLRDAAHSVGVFWLRALQSLGASYGMVPLQEVFPALDDAADGPGDVVRDAGAQAAWPAGRR